MTFIHITFIWRGNEKTIDQLRPIFDLAEDWVAYGGCHWIIFTSESLIDWNQRLQAVIDINQDSVVLCEAIGRESFAGWAPTIVVNWINKPRFIAGLLPIPPHS